MAGEFTGLTDAEWAVIEPFLPEQPEKPGKGRPHAFFRDILNTILWVLITGARWIDVPKGNGFGARSTSHRWLGIWTTDGIWANLKALLMGQAHELGLIDWSRSSVDGSFAAGKGGGEDVQYGFKGKGVTLHALVDGNGLPLSVISTGAAESERAQVEPLIDQTELITGKPGRPRKRPDAIQGDKGYDSRELRISSGREELPP